MSEEFRTHFFEKGVAYLFTDMTGKRYCVIAPDIETAITGYKNRHGEKTKEEPKNVEYIGSAVITQGCDLPLPPKMAY